MQVKDFYYDLPEELIAQDPLLDRSSSKLMLLDKESGEIKHEVFSNITDYLRAGDCLVLNNTRVIPARLYGIKSDTGASIELLLLKRLDANSWETLVKPGKKCRLGAKLSFGDGILNGEITEVMDDGNRIITFSYEGIFEEILDKLGQMPLPPYITHELKDKNRYQTVYAKYDGSAAAPTAGLHFTPELLEKIKAMGVDIAEVTLHVGLGTFRPVKAETVDEHHMHSEYFEITKDAADKINAAKREGRRVIAVGTTSCRTLESAASKNSNPETGTIQSDYDGSYVIDGVNNKLLEQSGWTEIFIYPGYSFKVIDALITNFHLPESTLLMLVSALAGRENVMHAYEKAIENRYRFFSFGDAMFLM